MIFILENASLEVARVGKVSSASVKFLSLLAAYVLPKTPPADNQIIVLGSAEGVARMFLRRTQGQYCMHP